MKHIWSFFSGAMGLDIGFEAVGLSSSLVIETDKDCRETIMLNRPNLTLASLPVRKPGDVSKLSGKDLRTMSGVKGDVFMFIGGPPCQSFSTGGKRSGLGDPRGNLIYDYLRLIAEIKPKYFLLENVANLLTAAIRHRPISERPGQHWSLKRYADSSTKYDDGRSDLEDDEKSGSAIRFLLDDIKRLGYGISLSVLNAADFGAPQKRMRLFIVGSREGQAPEMPQPSHYDPLSGRKPTYRTLKDAIWDLRSSPGQHSVYTPTMMKYFDHVPQGGNWRDLPESMQAEALGEKSLAAGGGKTGFFRRLSWNQPAPTIIGRANRKGSAICHPSDTRPLSVRECARLQGFPDNWQFYGSMSSQYLQIGNAVPVFLGKAIGQVICDFDQGLVASERKSIELQIQQATQKVRSAARNHKARAKFFAEQSTSLFQEIYK